MKKVKILVIGARGQIGAELIRALEVEYGRQNVTAADIQEEQPDMSFTTYVTLDVRRQEGS